MQLTAFTDYSLRVLMHAAAHPEGRSSTADVADAFGISRNHAVKVVHGLRRMGYLETTRGRHGGFRLARPADQISLGDVVRRTEGTIALVECFGSGSRCPLTPACGIREALGEAADAFFAVLDRRTLADVVGQPHWAARVRQTAGLRWALT